MNSLFVWQGKASRFEFYSLDIGNWKTTLNSSYFFSLHYHVSVIFLRAVGLERNHLQDHHPWNYEGFVFPFTFVCIFQIFCNVHMYYI